MKHLLTHDYRQDLFRESEGHPYVVKILLGEVAKAGKTVPVKRIMADADEVLTALFERTWMSLSPAAQRVFLTLSSWRSTIPMLALEAVLLREDNEKMPVLEAVEELERSSFVELVTSDADDQLFINTPFVAAIFGKRKLAVSPMKSAVEADTQLLQLFGAGEKTDIRHGVGPRIERLVRSVALRASRKPEVLDENLPMLEYIARHYPPTWLRIADLHEEFSGEQSLDNAKHAVRAYLEVADAPQTRMVWRRLAGLCKQSNDTLSEIHALVEQASLPNAPYYEASNAANRLNQLLAVHQLDLEREGKLILGDRVVKLMERRIEEADARDCSRLAWLCLNIDQRVSAGEYVKQGLAMDPDNEYCQRLAERLAI